jgi:hypothetical protein
MIAFYPFKITNQNMQVNDNLFAYIVILVEAVSAYLAAQFVKKDIELIKSSERIR